MIAAFCGIMQNAFLSHAVTEGIFADYFIPCERR